jgi:periplasmic protein TonB
MATCEHPSDLVLRIAYPSSVRPGLRIRSRIPAVRAEEGKQLSVRSNLQENEVGDIFYLVEPRPLNQWAAIGALAFLSLVVLALILVPLYLTDPLPQRERLTMLYFSPPPAAGGSSSKLQAPRPAPTASSKSIAIPVPVQKMHQAPSAPANTPEGLIGGVPGGVAGGVPGGMLAEVLGGTRGAPPAKASGAAPIKRVRLAPRIVEANLIHDVTPTYPPEAGRERIEGTVVLLAVIGKDGTVQDVRVESGLPVLAQAAIDAVKQWRYRPYLLNGEPVEVDSRITINFALSRG